ncbi:hypothetical protein TELCIR_25283, partial [Teladorsagia circumcincta]
MQLMQLVAKLGLIHPEGNRVLLLCGYTSGNCKQENYSALLEKLNNDPAREAEHVYAMWSD